MSTKPDRLYELLPAIYRIRDAEQGEPLKALLQVINEQAEGVENDIAQLYENWFIETCEDWVVPYIADLIGYQPVHEAGEPTDIKTQQGQLRNKILIPRREVANTLRYRKRKGTLALLELLTNDITGWPARAVEFYQLLGWTQALNHMHLERGQTVNLRNNHQLEMLDSPFDELAHTVDVRRINSRLTVGRHNIPSVGVFVWRLRYYAVTETQAYCVEGKSPHCFTFSVLGNDAPLFINPEPETDPTHIANEFNLPVPIRRSLIDPAHKESTNHLYGKGKENSFHIWIGMKRGKSNDIEPQPLPLHYKIIPADLSGWRYLPSRNTVAIDSVLGRIAFSPQQIPKYGVWVNYHYGFSADIGGGEYDRELLQHAGAEIYRVNQTKGPYKTIAAAIKQWEDKKPIHAVIEIDDSRVYVEPIRIAFADNRKSLQLRAGNKKRPVIRLLDWQTNQPDALTIIGDSGEYFSLDGIMVTGRGVQLSENLKQVTIRHSTLVPGWSVDCDCQPECPTEPSLEIFSTGVCVDIEHSILGSIQINPALPDSDDEAEIYRDTESDEESETDTDTENSEVQPVRCEGAVEEARLDPIRLCISDSIIDATNSNQEAIGGPGCPVGYAVLTIKRSTVLGQVQVHAIELGENCIFDGLVTVARRQYGCVRFSYVTPDSRTPSRYMCQPDLAEHQIEENLRRNSGISLTSSEIEAAKNATNCERIRVKPQFNSTHYGTPTYCQLALNCAQEIKRGADDESEMGVFHHLFQPQREANLRIRLDEYVPAGADVGVIFAS
ncbi:MAG: hypothetical protein LZF64_09490 [Nitrosomonas sp.]|uniref:hypothetical protein n=1 Tax=Nitrosomonas sp. TaxID=42353 RepID=UPI001A58AC03|nr:hypothetical protein [Nitrosomonas sp.]MBL8501388.1 hypothetical protein [Nitrosomonas sp.]MCG7755293.1 hypothetical protein [Nitrosomonas sp.]UJO99433.1 MAG: hypothetical protein LZF64_09490 [Nitrosomonas sp.]UJP02829.1 MAG: hypothetical protein LZF85_13905 [Nitrosomonas sp.]